MAIFNRPLLASQQGATIPRRVLSPSNPPLPSASSPLNTLPSGYNLARGTSYGTMLRPSLCTIPEDRALTHEALSEKPPPHLHHNQRTRQSRKAGRQLAACAPGEKWSKPLKMWIIFLLLVWAVLMIMVVNGRMDNGVVGSLVEKGVAIKNYLSDPTYDIMKGRGSRGGKGRKKSGGGEKKSSAAAGAKVPSLWYSAVVAGGVFVMDQVLDGVF